MVDTSYAEKLRTLNVRRPGTPTSKTTRDDHYEGTGSTRSHVVEVTERSARHPQGEGQDVTVRGASAPTLKPRRTA